MSKTVMSNASLKLSIAVFSSVCLISGCTSHMPRWQPDRGQVERMAKSGQGINYDESRVPQYELPDPLISEDGEHIKTKDDWSVKRRPELMRLFRDHVYGNRPDTVYAVDYIVVSERQDMFGVGAAGSQVRATVRAENKTHAFEFTLVIPRSDRPAPLVILINNRYPIPLERAAGEEDPFWPVELLVRQGYAAACFHTSDVDPDRPDGYASGVRVLLDRADTSPDRRWAALSAWGWGASRVLDYALARPDIDSNRTAVVGHSRGGKAALWAGSEDQRFKLVYSNNSGCGGAALSRRSFGETVGVITRAFPHWFCPAFASYAGREADLPIDQHQLISLIAPRGVYIASAGEDLWADPRGEYTSLIAAAPVYQLFGLKHLDKPVMPPLDTPSYAGATGYHIRSGKHNLTRQDWVAFLDFADQYFAWHQHK